MFAVSHSWSKVNVCDHPNNCAQVQRSAASGAPENYALKKRETPSQILHHPWYFIKSENWESRDRVL